MAVNVHTKDGRARLQRALQYSWEQSSEGRERRREFINMYKGEGTNSLLVNTSHKKDLVNLIRKFVRAQQVTLAFQVPKCSVKSRMPKGRGFDRHIQNLLTRYLEILEMKRLLQQWASDSCFGYAVAKVIAGPAPKGVTAPVAPRAYRVDPDRIIQDRSAAHPNEGDYIAEMYLLPLEEAQNWPGFNPTVARGLAEWTDNDDFGMLPDGISSRDALAQPYTRLVDVYIPTTGEIITWPCNNLRFSGIAHSDPLVVSRTPINPYEFWNPIMAPSTLAELSLLDHEAELHSIANRLLHKVIDQADASRRNPYTSLGYEQDLATVQSSEDNDMILFDNPEGLRTFSLPGADPSVHGLATWSIDTFSREGGNLDLRLGQHQGADTARQTQSLLGQLSASTALDRDGFNDFFRNICVKLASLAFRDEYLELYVSDIIPGTNISYNHGWAPPKFLPRIGQISDYHFEIATYSGTYRSPQEKLSQLEAASRGVLNWMTAAAQGAPIDLEAIIKDYAEAFDQVPDLINWWNKKEPTPTQQAVTTYRSMSPPGSSGGQVSALQSNDNRPPEIIPAPPPPQEE